MNPTFSKDKNLYSILSISRTASKDEIKKAYRKMAHKYHPDKNPNNPDAEEKFKEIQYAYDILYDDFQRLQYNEFLDEVAQQNNYSYNYSHENSNQNSQQNSDFSYYQNYQQENTQNQYRYNYQNPPIRRNKKGFLHYIIAILFPFLSFFLIGRPLAGIVCLLFQISTANIGHIIAAIWAVSSVNKYNKQIDLLS